MYMFVSQIVGERGNGCLTYLRHFFCDDAARETFKDGSLTDTRRSDELYASFSSDEGHQGT